MCFILVFNETLTFCCRFHFSKVIQYLAELAACVVQEQLVLFHKAAKNSFFSPVTDELIGKLELVSICPKSKYSHTNDSMI